MKLQRLTTSDSREGSTFAILQIKAGQYGRQAGVQTRNGTQIDRRFGFGARTEILRDARYRVALGDDAAAVDHDHPLTQLFDAGQVVTDEQDRATLVGHLAHAAQALLLKPGDTPRPHFVPPQD